MREFPTGKVLRTFEPCTNSLPVVSDLGKIKIASWDQISFVHPSGGEWDIVQTDWGFYATPSLNSRLIAEGFQVALFENIMGKRYVVIVAMARLWEFEVYLERENHTLIAWIH